MGESLKAIVEICKPESGVGWLCIGTWDFGKDYDLMIWVSAHAPADWPGDGGIDKDPTVDDSRIIPSEIALAMRDDGRAHSGFQWATLDGLRCGPKRPVLHHLLVALTELESSGIHSRVLFYRI